MEGRQAAVAHLVTIKTPAGAACRRAARRSWLAAPLVAVFAATCTQDGAEPEPDSGFVSVDVADAEEWMLDGSPLFVLGDDETDPLSSVFGGLLMDSGRVVVADRGAHRVLVVNAEGRTERIVGGEEGEGPMEFTTIARVARWPGDSVFVYDSQLNRYTVFSVATGEGRSTMLRGTEVVPGSALPAGDGELWLLGGLRIVPGDFGPGRQRIPIELFRYVDSDSIPKVAEMAGPELVFGQGGVGFTMPPVPVAAGTSLSASDDRLFVSDGERPVVTVMDRNGATVGEIEVAGMDIQVTDDLRDMITDSLYANVARSEERMRSRLEKAPIPAQINGFGPVNLAADGTLWLPGRGVPGIEMRPWVNLTLDGRRLRRFDLPRSVGVLDASADRLLLRRWDALGVERVEVHAIARR